MEAKADIEGLSLEAVPIAKKTKHLIGYSRKSPYELEPHGDALIEVSQREDKQRNHIQ